LIHDRSRQVDELSMHGNAAVRRMMREYESRLATIGGKIESLSPLAVLARGYTITQDARTGQVIRRANKLRVGQTIVTRFSDGMSTSEVKSVDE
jgi:exodeoxyribonuclease VII large subunit